MKILYVSQLHQGSSAHMRLLALQRMGHEVIPLDTNRFASTNPVLGKISFLLAAGPKVELLNREVILLPNSINPTSFGRTRCCNSSPPRFSVVTLSASRPFAT